MPTSPINSNPQSNRGGLRFQFQRVDAAGLCAVPPCGEPVPAARDHYVAYRRDHRRLGTIGLGHASTNSVVLSAVVWSIRRTGRGLHPHLLPGAAAAAYFSIASFKVEGPRPSTAVVVHGHWLVSKGARGGRIGVMPLARSNFLIREWAGPTV